MGKRLVEDRDVYRLLIEMDRHGQGQRPVPASVAVDIATEILPERPKRLLQAALDRGYLADTADNHLIVPRFISRLCQDAKAYYRPVGGR